MLAAIAASDTAPRGNVLCACQDESAAETSVFKMHELSRGAAAKMHELPSTHLFVNPFHQPRIPAEVTTLGSKARRDISSNKGNLALAAATTT
jgi:hypothetical protein